MNELEKMIHIALFTPGLNNRWGLPLLFWGEPGVGKSKRIETFTQWLQLKVYTLIASIREPSDFGGLPIPIKRGSKTFIEYTPPGWAADLEIDGDGRGVVFTDEITTCFCAGTPVTMANGHQKNIEEIRVTDWVLSIDVDNQTPRINSVTNTTSRCAATFVVTLCDGRSLVCTEDHPFWTKTGWVHAGQLKHCQDVGTFTETYGMSWQAVNNVEPTGFTEIVYDITVEKDHNFIANGVLVHNCAPAVQAALLRMILNGALGDYKLPIGVRFIAAANATEDAAGGWDLSPPLANRFGHVHWDTSGLVDGWIDWMTGANQTSKIDDLLENWDGAGELPSKEDVPELPQTAFNPDEEERRVLREWPEAFAKAKGMVSSFINARRDLLHSMPKAGSAKRSRAWCSPRSWELATRALGGCLIHRADENLINEFITAFVGHSAATEFQTFRSKLDLPDPAGVLDGKIDFEHIPTRLDRTVAILSSCTAMIMSPNCEKRNERAITFWDILAKIDEASTDLIIKPAAALVQENLGMTSPSMKPVLIHLRPILKESGVKVR